MKKIYSRHLEISIDNGETWEFAGFFKNLFCYMEEAEKRKVDTFTSYEELAKELKEWNIAHIEKQTFFKKRKYIIIKVPFETLRIWNPKDVQIRIRYKEEKNSSVEDLMKNMSNQDFVEWAKDNKIFENRG